MRKIIAMCIIGIVVAFSVGVGFAYILTLFAHAIS
jgi:hypothetical protein